MIICYGLIALEAILIIILFLKIHGANSDMEILKRMTIGVRDDYDRLLDTWKRSIDNADEITAIAKGALAQNEALLMQLKDKEEKEKGCGV